MLDTLQCSTTRAGEMARMREPDRATRRRAGAGAPVAARRTPRVR
jgi:hypothetical protein